MEEFNYEQRIQSAVKEIQKLLIVNKTATLLEDEDHLFADKYTVVESVSSAMIFGLLNCFNALGWKQTKIDSLQPTKFKVVVDESCTFIKKVQQQIPQGGVINEKSSGIFKSKSKSEFFTLVDEYHWNLKMSITAVIENGSNTIVLFKQSMERILKNQADMNPRANYSPKREFEVLISDFILFSNSFEFNGNFSINKTDVLCFTPSRNKEIEKLVDFVRLFGKFCCQVGECLDDWFRIEDWREEIDIPLLRFGFKILVPVVPIMKETLPTTLVQDHQYSIQSKNKSLEEPIAKLNSSWAKFASFSNLFVNMFDIAQAFHDGVMYIEELLRKQVVQAIGKHVNLKEIQDYMVFHSRKLFQENIIPQPFVSDVRVKGCTPEGTISTYECGGKEPLYTTTKYVSKGHAVSIRLNASTSVKLQGSHHLHGAITYQFSTQQNVHYELHAKARQFSSFVILIGTMVSNTEFNSKYGMIVQNKDFFVIPLLFEAIPSAAEFRDAIQSLSIEQQDFCKMFRKMQLESNTFAVVVVQIKPQLERVLDLENGALTKEIKLNQDIMKLLLEYQIPTDLLKFEGEATLSGSEKVQKVRESVQMVLSMIEDSKKEEADERKRVAELKNLEANVPRMTFMAAPPPPPAMLTRSAPSGMTPPAPMTPSVIIQQQEQQLQRQSVGQGVQTATLAVEIQSAEPVPTTDRQIQEPPSYDDSLEYTKISTAIDLVMDKYVSNVRPVIIKQSGIINHTFSKSLLSRPSSTNLYDKEKKAQHDKALELLDCLSRSGELDMLDSQVHVVYAIQQGFDDTVMDTIICKNENPIVKMEKSMVLLGRVIHQLPIEQLLLPSKVDAVKRSLPNFQ
jgi:uncharacterized protein (DUF1499 family)